MIEDVAAPVKGLISAFHKGALSTQRICKIADNGSATQKLDTLEPAQALEKTLGVCQARLRDTYAQSSKIFGRKFTESICNDQTCTSRIQGLTINLLDNLLNLNDYMVDPNAFDYGSFRYLQRDAERCCDQALHALGQVHQNMLQAGLQLRNMSLSDDRSQLSSVRGLGIVPASPEPPPTLKPPHPRANSISATGTTPTGNVPRPRTNSSSTVGPPPFPKSDAWSQRKPVPSPFRASGANAIPQNSVLSQNEPNIPTGTSYGNFTPAIPTPTTPENATSESSKSPRDVREVQTTKQPEAGAEDFIASDVIVRQVTANLEFLEKRRMSRISFMNNLEQSRQSIIVSPISPAQPRSSATSPFLPGGSFVMTPIQSSLPKNNLLSTTTSGSTSPDLSRKSRGNSIIHERSESITSQDLDSRAYLRPKPTTPQRQNSEPFIFGPPESPPVSEGRQSGFDEWGGSVHTRSIREFSEGIEEGLEVVGKVVDDPEKMLVNEDRGQPTPALSIQSSDCPMRHDASFYKYGGFCDSAKMILRREQGALKVVKRPAGVYNGAMLVSQKCIKCQYEVSFNTWERDQALDRKGIFDAGGDLRFRHRFLSKSHMPMASVDAVYACIFCVEENTTIEDHDATVFFSHQQLFRHLLKHPRPLRPVEGLKVIYGDCPDAVDFDLHFKTMNWFPNPLAGVSARLSANPSGYALVNHRPRAKGFRERDPEQNKTLEFAIGAKIVGITYPARFNGTWCSGYHDGEKALFPASTIQLEPPSHEDVTMNPKSSFTVTAKWDHKYKDSNPGGWLSFSKKDKIIHVAFPYQDHWCWTGQNSKGKWGIFPSQFVEGLVEVQRAAPGGLSAGSFLSGGLSPGGISPSGLSPARRDRSTSPTTSGVTLGGTPIPGASAPSRSPASPTGGHHHWGSLGKLSFKRSGTMESASNGSDSARSPA